MTDLLFNLLLTFVALFFLSFILVNDPTEDEATTDNRNRILISMNWNTDTDVDLWVKLPDGRKVYYGNRQEDPLFLDLDIVSFGTYRNPDGTWHTIDNNEEIVTVRGVLAGEYVVNGHYFSNRAQAEPFEVEVVIRDIDHRRIIWAGKQTFSDQGSEKHFVKFTVVETVVVNDEQRFRIEDVTTSRTEYVVGR